MSPDDDPDIAADRIAWTRRHMPLLASLRSDFEARKPFADMTIGFRIHLEPKTAILVETLQAGGAAIVAMGNEATTQFGTVAVLRSWGAEVMDAPGDGSGAISSQLSTIARRRPDLVLDNGAELIEACVAAHHLPVGATEETTSGAYRLRERLAGDLPFPVIVINDSPLKSIVENKYAVGESVIDTLIHVTNLSLHRRRVVVFGYGWCGRGIAQFARHRGAVVTVVEPDPVKALEAAFDGHTVAGPLEAMSTADMVITATGRSNVVTIPLIRALPDGAILANAGHDPNEIDIDSLMALAPPRTVAPSIEAHDVEGAVFVVARGRMVNLAAEGARGNSIESMDLGFALQARSLSALASSEEPLASGPQPVPSTINAELAGPMLGALGQRWEHS